MRLRVTTHVTTATVEQLPIPTAEAAPAACREIASLARLLARRSDATARARLNARVAELYQLSVEEFEYILSTFPLIPREDREGTLRLFIETTTPREPEDPRWNRPRSHGDTEDHEMDGPQSHRDTEFADLNRVTARIIGCAIEVHKVLGPGLAGIDIRVGNVHRVR